MGVYLKLLKIQREVDILTRDGKSNPNFNYPTGLQVIGKIRPLMNDLGLLLKQETLDIINVRQDYVTSKGYDKHEILTTLKMRFTWVDTETGERDENLFAANGQNDWDKGVGSALTYGERYFLMKYFHIPTDEDDPDYGRKNTGGAYAKRTTRTQSAQRQKSAPVKDDRPWLDLATRDGEYTAKFFELEDYISKGKTVTLKSLQKKYRVSRKEKTILAEEFGITE